MEPIGTAEDGLITAVTPVLVEHEADRRRVYDDIYGIPTIAVGFNLTRPDAQALCRRCGASYQRLLGGLDELTEAQSIFLTRILIIEVIEWLTKIFPDFWKYSRPRQIALVDMGFNLGETRFRGFKMMISSIIAGMWFIACSQALDSKWARELPKRAKYDTDLMRAG